jgi:hypothetical protein
MIPKPGKCTQNVPNGHTISTFSNLRPSKNYPNWDFWIENKPSGSPDKNWTEEERFFKARLYLAGIMKTAG